MRYPTRNISWQGRTFHFERMTVPRLAAAPDWAVSCGLEFIGTMNCRVDVTTGEFEVRCVRWLSELLG